MIFSLGILSCTVGDKPGQAENKESDVRVVKEFYPDGRLKSSTEAVGNLRQGVSREYRSDGTLESEIHYDRNRKHGVARNFYPDGETPKTEIHYVNGYKQGEAKWFYKGGEVYRVTPYKNNNIHGIRRYYYENGQIQAELNYVNGQPGTGLREYTREGKLKQFDGVIQIREEDRLKTDNTFVLHLNISDGTRNVEFFKGELTDGTYWNDKLREVPTEKGTGKITIFVNKGEFKMETLNLVARMETNLGHTRIIQKEYHLAVENKF